MKKSLQPALHIFCFSDKKNYRVIRLENGLTALLISDESYSLAKLDEEEKNIVEDELTGKVDSEDEDIDEEEEAKE